MRRALGQALRIGVSGHAVSLLRTSRWRGARLTLLAEHALLPSADHPHHAIAQALRALLGEQKLAGWPVSIVLADELARMWQVTPPQGATRLADIEAAAALRFQSLYGAPPSGWQLMADWDTRHPFLAAAVPQSLLTVLEQVAQEQRLQVVEIVPHFIGAWNRWHRALKNGAWFGMVHEQLLSIGAVRERRLHTVRVLPVPAGADQHWLTQTLTREALLLDLPMPALLQLCGAVPATWGKPGTQAGHIRCAQLDPLPQSLAGWSSAGLLARAGSLS